MTFGRNIQNTPEYSLHASVFMWVCLLSRYHLWNYILKIARACFFCGTGGVMRNFFVTSRDEIYKTALAVINWWVYYV